MNLPTVKLDKGIHVMHLFYRFDRARWSQLPAGESANVRARLEKLCAANSAASHPTLRTYANVGGKADIAFFLLAADLVQLGQIHRDLEAAFPPGVLQRVYSYLSVTELTDYMPTEEDSKRRAATEFKLTPGTPEFDAKLVELGKLRAEYEHYRLYPELPDWEVMSFYPMNKRRDGADNWYVINAEDRKKLMSGHARVGRKYGGRISQLISGSTGLDDWEWGVTLVAHQVDPLKEIVYEMRFDEVSARYGEFGEFYINLRLSPVQIWEHLRL
ncbi:MAG: heme-dependent peroxidase [Pedosphaera sp.]|nr:heme-dependent peroxidase [Pedosphaera sp.]MSS99760.1 heme-dependent peroxidase [Pedosphaera sp.]